MEATSYIRFKVIWSDSSIFEIQIDARNSCFSGSVSAYAEETIFAAIADRLRGFPRDLNDARELQLGSDGTDYPSGGLRLTMHVLGPTGLGLLKVELVDNTNYQESVSLAFHFYAASLDRFVAQLEACRLEVGAWAELTGM